MHGDLAGSCRSQDMEDIAVLDDVGFAFQAIDAVALGFLHGADAAEVVVADDLAADEAACQVGVDLGGAFDRRGPAAYGPGAAFILADGEEDNLAHVMEDLAED